MGRRYPNFANEAVTHGVSDAAAAALANGLLRDLGLLRKHSIIDEEREISCVQ